MTTWIGGYLRSGTTWMKFIITGLMYKTNTPKIVERKIPNVVSPEDAKDKKIYKCHCLKPPEGKKIYMVRHPVDVCVSLFNYIRLTSGKADINKHVEKFIKKEGEVIRNYGPWNQHVKNWVTQNECMVIKYEELLKHPYNYCLSLWGYLNIERNNIEYAVENTKFSVMRKLEKKGVVKKSKNVPDVFYNPKNAGYKNGLQFINKGKSGYAKEYLTDVQIKRIIERFSEGMEIAGYECIY